MKKIAILIVAMATLSMFFVSVSIAAVPAPPVNQDIGFDDVEFTAMTEDECRGCHFAGLPNAHHMKYGSAMTIGMCNAVLGTCESDDAVCGADEDCSIVTPAVPDTCTDGTCDADTEETCADASDCDPISDDVYDICTLGPEIPCTNDDDCTVAPLNLCANGGGICDPELSVRDECGSSRTSCGDALCIGAGALVDNPNDGVYGCLSCHKEDTSGGVTNFIVERDCQVCHANNAGPNVHHLNKINLDDPEDTICVSCHGDLVDDGRDGHIVPTYAPSLVTPMPHNSDESGQLPGGCAYCHDAGDEDGLEVVDNYSAHHHTGVYKDRFGNSLMPVWDGNKDGTTDPDGERICGLCHLNNNYHPSPGTPDKLEGIRQCELCHGMESLHSIQADTNGGEIVVGGELAGYGHVGANNPGGEDDCWGCHGFSFSSTAAPGSATITPSIDDVSPVVITAGTATQITVSGNAFINDGISSTITLTAADGTVTPITPSIVSVDSITATVNVSAGAYKLRAVKVDVASNPVAIIVIPDTSITITSIDSTCGGCKGTATISGSGFGIGPLFDIDENAINVMQNGFNLTIVSWTDTEITVSGTDTMCDDGPITVNAIGGSATK